MVHQKIDDALPVRGVEKCLKFRGSHGETGARPVGDHLSISRIAQSGSSSVHDAHRLWRDNIMLEDVFELTRRVSRQVELHDPYNLRPPIDTGKHVHEFNHCAGPVCVHG